ncbi:MAG: ComEC/Rec2 family competence protein [Candidatus Levybacteria bacterium]|nr:ComEC/Rec2 family competence protein [Candidatus Levybacteria bacterium]
MLKLTFVILLSLLLCLRLFLFYHNRETFNDSQKVTLEAVLLTEPQIKGRLQRFSIRAPNGQRIFISTAVYPRYHYGEELTFAGIVQKSKTGVYFLSFPSISRKVNQNLFGNLFSFLGLFRGHIITFFQKILPSTSAGLLLGIVFGIREQIPNEFANALRSSGMLHVVAASGMNVSIIISMLAAFSIRFFKRKYALMLVIPVVLFYCLLAGFDPPIVRACIMGILAIAASLFGRQYFGLLALAMSAYIMLFIWPYLPFDIGFQLSFMATLGIIMVKPVLLSNFSGGVSLRSKETPLKTWKRLLMLPVDDIRITIAAQIATLPILLFSFGQYGVLSLLANAVTLWMVPILMALGLLAALISFVVSPLAQGILFLTLPLLLFFEQTVMLIGSFHADITFHIPMAMVVGYYFLLGAGVILQNKKRKS